MKSAIQVLVALDPLRWHCHSSGSRHKTRQDIMPRKGTMISSGNRSKEYRRLCIYHLNDLFPMMYCSRRHPPPSRSGCA